ncbi:MAG: HAMP domain-containing sensor histidine kinase, partial [bacterium]|nr:HAMP domain-containing sensor histidine kinase [bacterium]MDY4098746.1 HAMP domain-containing sensor histidine kinase [Lachnospiraceae bacterium]
HSLVLLTLAFLFWKNNLEDNDLIELQAKYQKAAVESEQTAETLKNKLEDQIRLCEKKDQDLIDANLRIRALNEELSGVRASADSARAALAEAESEDSYEALLPPIDPSESPSETIDIIRIAKDTISELSEFAKKVNLNIVLSAPDGSMLVKANRGRIRILFRNIIDNSIKYMNRSGSLLITISSIGDDIFIVLKDNGNGLSEHETKHIFELNYQGTNRVSGNGLGLTQAKAIVDYYGGSIYAKSMIGRGMGIYIQLPTT